MLDEAIVRTLISVILLAVSVTAQRCYLRHRAAPVDVGRSVDSLQEVSHCALVELMVLGAGVREGQRERSQRREMFLVEYGFPDGSVVAVIHEKARSEVSNGGGVAKVDLAVIAIDEDP